MLAGAASAEDGFDTFVGVELRVAEVLSDWAHRSRRQASAASLAPSPPLEAEPDVACYIHAQRAAFNEASDFDESPSS